MAGIDPAKRQREDRLPKSLLKTIETWLEDSGAEDLRKWSHAFLAHAGGPEERKKIETKKVTIPKIRHAIKMLARVTKAISANLLFAGGRTNALMPTAQFNPFADLDKPIMQPNGESDAYARWDRLTAEQNSYLANVNEDLIRGANAYNK